MHLSLISCNKKVYYSFLIVSIALRSSQCCSTSYAFDSSCPVAKVADTKTNRMSFGEGFRDLSEQKVLEKHLVLLENLIDCSSQNQCGVLGLEFCFT